jgi:hypothetical protein
MPAGTSRLKRRNHTVNKSYLRRFADDRGLLTRVALPGHERIPISVTDATVIRNFYVVTLPDGTETDEAEDLFGKVEAAAVTVIRSLVDDRLWPVPDTARTDIARWAALQYLRVPWVRQLGREIAEGFSNAGIPVRTGSGERVTVKMPADAIDELTGPRLHLDLIERQLAAVTEMLCQRNWIFSFYQRRTLATSDAPVVLHPAAGQPPGTGVGIANAGQVDIPLDRRVALSMGDASTGDLRVHGVTKTAIFLNGATARNARRYLFHHPGDDPLRGIRLPGPRRRELSGPAEAAGLVDDLFS